MAKMSGPYAYTPAIWPSVFTVLLLVALAVYAWQRRGVPGVLPFMIAILFGALWAAGSGLEVAAADMATKIFWFKFHGVCQLPGVTASTCFVLEYAWPGRWLTRRNLALLSIPCLLFLGLALTNDLHHLIWRGFAYGGIVIPLRGPVNWMLVVYGYGLIVLNLVVFAWLFLRSPQHRWPVVIMGTGQIGARLVYALEAARVIQSNLPVDVFEIAFQYLMYAIALFGFRLFDPVALARLTLMEQLSDGMLVLDHQGRVAGLNPAAERIFGLTARQVKDKPVREVLPAYPDELQPVTSGTEIEFSLPASGGVSHYRLVISLLNDRRGQQVGRLLLLHNVTEQKRAQAQLVEQQRVVATLQERERLARELHDSIGQMLGYVSMQAQAIRKWAREGEMAIVDVELARLTDAAREAHVDIRESILDLKAGSEQATSFLAVLQQHLDSFQDHYGIRTELTIPAGLTDEAFEPVTQVQLLRVIQEAMTNARKHGRARCVRVAIERADGQARITVADDGCGFDPGQLSAGEGDHLGLAFMRERMAQVGGRLTIQSRPGAGTEVVFEVP